MPHLHDSSVSVDRAAERQLLVNDFGYQLLRNNLVKLSVRGDPDLLQRAEEVGRYAWAAHPGRFADGVVENILLEAGRVLETGPLSAPLPGSVAGETRTLHVASELYLTGGHSRVLAKWVQRDSGSSHDIVVTRQSGPMPEYLTAIADDRGAKSRFSIRATAFVNEHRSCDQSAVYMIASFYIIIRMMRFPYWRTQYQLALRSQCSTMPISPIHSAVA